MIILYIIIGTVFLYFIIKSAVKKAIKESLKETSQDIKSLMRQAAVQALSERDYKIKNDL